jgi:hypothetical protein
LAAFFVAVHAAKERKEDREPVERGVVEGMYFSHSFGGLLAFSATPESAAFS